MDVAKTRLILACTLSTMLLISGSCASDPGEAGLVWRGVRLQDGPTAISSNPAIPLLTPAQVRAERSWTLAAPGPHGLWERPQRIAVNGEELFVLDQMAHAVHVVSTEGTYRRSFGRSGSGPGELRAPYDMVVTDSLVIIGDGGKGTLEFFSHEGAFQGSTVVGRVGFRLLAVDGTSVLVMSLLGDEGGWRLYTPEEQRGSYALPRQVLFAGDSLGECARHSSATRGTIIRASCTLPRFETIEGNRVDRATIVSGEHQIASDEELAALQAQVERQVAEVGYPAERARQVVRDIVERERVKRIYQGVQRDPVSGWYFLLEQSPEELGRDPATVHLFSSTGIYVAAVPLGVRFLDFVAHGMNLSGITEGQETGLPSLSSYRLTISSDTLRAIEALEQRPSR